MKTKSKPGRSCVVKLLADTESYATVQDRFLRVDMVTYVTESKDRPFALMFRFTESSIVDGIKQNVLNNRLWRVHADIAIDGVKRRLHAVLDLTACRHDGRLIGRAWKDIRASGSHISIDVLVEWLFGPDPIFLQLSDPYDIHGDDDEPTYDTSIVSEAICDLGKGGS